jgi:hypothetical protein
MRNLLVVVLCLLFAFASKAEYNGWLLKLVIEQTDGNKFVVFSHVPSYEIDKDSIKNSKYLFSKRFILNKNGFYLNAVKYVFQNPYSGGKAKIETYKLLNSTKVNILQIKQIEIVDIINFGYSREILNDLSLNDSIWIKTKPLNSESCQTYFCSYNIFSHENNNQIERLIHSLKIKCKQIEKEESEKEIRNDKEALLIIKKLTKYKVVVVNTCTD